MPRAWRCAAPPSLGAPRRPYDARQPGRSDPRASPWSRAGRGRSLVPLQRRTQLRRVLRGRFAWGSRRRRADRPGARAPGAGSCRPTGRPGSRRARQSSTRGPVAPHPPRTPWLCRRARTRPPRHRRHATSRCSAAPPGGPRQAPTPLRRAIRDSRRSPGAPARAPRPDRPSGPGCGPRGAPSSAGSPSRRIILRWRHGNQGCGYPPGIGGQPPSLAAFPESTIVVHPEPPESRGPTVISTDAYVIRKATVDDDETLRTLAELDSQRPLHRPALIGEIDGYPAAAASLIDGRVVSDPFLFTVRLRQVLQIRVGALQAYARTPSLPERLRASIGTVPVARATAA